MLAGKVRRTGAVLMVWLGTSALLAACSESDSGGGPADAPDGSTPSAGGSSGSGGIAQAGAGGASSTAGAGGASSGGGSSGGASPGGGGSGPGGGSSNGGTSGDGGAGGASGTGGAPPGNPLVDGWTDFPAQPGARVIYLSDSAGNDAWPGTEAQPKATFQAGVAELRDGQADVLLLRRGDTWELSGFMWTKSGPAADGAGWMRLGAYGDSSQPRPILDSGGDGGLVVTPGYQSPRQLTHVALTDVHLLASSRLAAPQSAPAGTAGLSFIAVEWQGGSGLPFEHFVLENVKIEGYGFGINTASDLADLSVRRSVFTRIFNPGGPGTHGSGILTAAQGLLLEENVFYLIQHPDQPSVTGISTFAHSAYIGAGAANVVSRGNHIIKTTEGLMQRAGGTYAENVSAYNEIATNIGMAWGVLPTPNGVVANVNDNLFLNPVGDFILGNTRVGTVRDNVVVIGPGGSGTPGIALMGYDPQGGGVNIGVHDVTFQNNWLTGNFSYSASQSDPQHFSGLTFTGNTVNGGTTTVTVADFLSSIGRSGTTIDDWGAELAGRDRGTFRADQLTRVMIDFYADAVRP